MNETGGQEVARRWAFGDFVLDEARAELRHHDRVVELRPQSFDVLRFLVANHGRLVTRDALLAEIWGGKLVTEDSITQCLGEIRKALGESAELIRTVRGRGYLFEPPVSVDRATALPGSRRRSSRANATTWGLVAATVLLTASALAWWFYDAHRGDAGPGMRPEGPTIAVLPFRDMSPGGGQAFLGDGLAEEVLHVLAGIPGLRVIARTSSFSIRNRPVSVPEIAEMFGATHVLEGSVRVTGDRIRVTSQLIDASTGTHLWSRADDHDLGELIELQRDIAAKVATTLRLTLVDARGPGARDGAHSLAHSHYLRGRFLLNRRAPGDLQAAESAFQEALELDPQHVGAIVGATAVLQIRLYDVEPFDRATYDRCGALLERALGLDSTHPEALLRQARQHWWAGEQQAAVRLADQALGLAPNDPLALSIMSVQAASVGDLDEALKLLERAVRVDPLGANARTMYASNLLGAGRLQDAEEQILQALHIKQTDPVTSSDLRGGTLIYVWLRVLQRRHDEVLAIVEGWDAGPEQEQLLAIIYAELGDFENSQAALGRLQARTGAEAAMKVAEVHAQLGRVEQAFGWLGTARERLGAVSAGAPLSAVVEVENFWISPFLRPLRGDPRWVPLFDELLAERFRAYSRIVRG